MRYQHFMKGVALMVAGVVAFGPVARARGTSTDAAPDGAGSILTTGLRIPSISSLVSEAKAAFVSANQVAEFSLTSALSYPLPFVQVELDVVFTAPDNKQSRIPAFWAGGNRWSFRYASPQPGVHRWRTECSDLSDPRLHNAQGTVEIRAADGENVFRRHGPIRIAPDQRHFEHADGTPFFWLGDTWWKCLCRRMTWEGFQELAADRVAKGFSVVQIVCGPYPDEEMFERRWENEGGMPYLTDDFSTINPVYFDFADRRIRHLVEAGLVPAIVGGWGREQAGGRSTIARVGLDGYKRHWRNIVARYGAFPVVWILGGEASDAQGPWSELARYVKSIDPFGRLLAYHAQGHPRHALKDNVPFDFDMTAIGHESWTTATATLEMLTSCRAESPTRPVLNGEACYEGHMQSNFQDVQRHLFWSCLLNGAAGHTYGAAGVWQASVEGDPGISPIYDWTTWREGMSYPGSTQLGLGKRMLEKTQWWRFEPHPEWAEPGCYAAGIPGEIRVLYLPRRNIYNWTGPIVKRLEFNVPWRAYYFDPATGRQFDLGRAVPLTTSSNDRPEFFDFQRDLPSPQDWVLVVERSPR